LAYKVYANIRLKTCKEGEYRIVSTELEIEGSAPLKSLDTLFASLKKQAVEKYGDEFAHIVNVRLVPPEEKSAQGAPLKLGVINGFGKGGSSG